MQAEFGEDVRRLFQDLQAEIASFNDWWPPRVRAGQVWKLVHHGPQQPFLEEGAVSVEEAEDWVEAAKVAIAQVEFAPLQDPNTTVRAPGWIALSETPTARIARINAARDAISARIEAEVDRIHQEKGGALAKATLKALRTRLTRQAVPGISLKQTMRSLQAFDTAPILMAFIWVSSSSCRDLTTVAAEREHIAAAQRAAPPKGDDHDNIRSGLEAALQKLENFGADERLMVVRRGTPHPKAMIYFSRRGRYDAMPHASLPLFFYCPPEAPLPDVRPLLSYQNGASVKEDGEPVRKRGKGGARTTMSLVHDANPNRVVYRYQPDKLPLKSARLKQAGDAIVSTYDSRRKKTSPRPTSDD